jgi:hypothetical protein
MHGFTVEFVFELVKNGLATAERLLIGDRPIELARIMITDAGRAALEGRKAKVPCWRFICRLQGTYRR